MSLFESKSAPCRLSDGSNAGVELLFLDAAVGCAVFVEILEGLRLQLAPVRIVAPTRAEAHGVKLREQNKFQTSLSSQNFRTRLLGNFDA